MGYNKCSVCGRQVEYTVIIRTDKPVILKGDTRLEYWCFNCIRDKIMWPAPSQK